MIRRAIDSLTAALAQVSRHGALLAAHSASVADVLVALASVLASQPACDARELGSPGASETRSTSTVLAPIHRRYWIQS